MNKSDIEIIGRIPFINKIKKESKEQELFSFKNALKLVKSSLDKLLIFILSALLSFVSVSEYDKFSSLISNSISLSNSSKLSSTTPSLSLLFEIIFF